MKHPVPPAPSAPPPVIAPDASVAAVNPADEASDQPPAEVTPRIVPIAERRLPWVQLKYFSFNPCLYPAMIKAVSPGVRPGALVTVYDKLGQPFGAGLYHPKARVPLRMFHHGDAPFGEEDFVALLERAVGLRLDDLRLPEQTEAFRVVHSDGDGLSGLVVDRFGDVLSVQVHSLGIWQRLPGWLPGLHERLGTRRMVVEVDPQVARMEGIRTAEIKGDSVKSVRIRENGIRYEVDFAEGHKTGFFCDQRDNRRRLSFLTRGRSVLDLCCYTGGFALSARVAGAAEAVTGVDLDENAVAQARRNGNLNQARVEWVHCDAFSYARQMQRNGRQWDLVVVDPPKLILSRDEAPEGYRKYEDLNRLATSLVKAGGMLVTCSCSGLLSAADFEDLVSRAAHRTRRRLQFLDRTGAAPDHPVMSNCPESRYLKVLWARVV